MTSKSLQRRSDLGTWLGTGLQLDYLSDRRRICPSFTVRLNCLDFAVAEFIALGSCQCRLTMFVSSRETEYGTSRTTGSIGCSADSAGAS
jgi:hypothetical protein